MHIQTLHRAQGLGLIEVLMALLVLAIGLLGIAQLQLASVKVSHNSALYSQASTLAYDVFDRMRSNPSAADAAAAARWPTAIQSSVWYNNIGLTNGNCIDTTNSCTASQMGNDDLYDWAEEVRTRLPNGTASVARTTTGSQVSYTVTIWWEERRSQTTGGQPAVQQLILQGQL